MNDLLFKSFANLWAGHERRFRLAFLKSAPRSVFAVVLLTSFCAQAALEVNYSKPSSIRLVQYPNGAENENDEHEALERTGSYEQPDAEKRSGSHKNVWTLESGRDSERRPGPTPYPLQQEPKGETKPAHPRVQRNLISTDSARGSAKQGSGSDSQKTVAQSPRQTAGKLDKAAGDPAKNSVKSKGVKKVSTAKESDQQKRSEKSQQRAADTVRKQPGLSWLPPLTEDPEALSLDDLYEGSLSGSVSGDDIAQSPDSQPNSQQAPSVTEESPKQGAVQTDPGARESAALGRTPSLSGGREHKEPTDSNGLNTNQGTEVDLVAIVNMDIERAEKSGKTSASTQEKSDRPFDEPIWNGDPVEHQKAEVLRLFSGGNQYWGQPEPFQQPASTQANAPDAAANTGVQKRSATVVSTPGGETQVVMMSEDQLKQAASGELPEFQPSNQGPGVSGDGKVYISQDVVNRIKGYLPEQRVDPASIVAQSSSQKTPGFQKTQAASTSTPERKTASLGVASDLQPGAYDRNFSPSMGIAEGYKPYLMPAAKNDGAPDQARIVFDVSYLDHSVQQTQSSIVDDEIGTGRSSGSLLKGVKAVAEVKQSDLKNGLEHQARIQWDLLAQGWREQNKSELRDAMEGKVLAMQAQNVGHEGQKNLFETRWRSIESEVGYRSERLREPIINNVVLRYQKQLKQGLITRRQLADAALQLKHVRQEQALHEKELEYMGFRGLTEDERTFLNRVENTRVKNHSELLAMMDENALPLQISTLESKRVGLEDDYWDDATLRLFVEQRKDQTYSNDTIMGVRAELPLDFSRRSSVADYRKHRIQVEQRAYRQQADAELRELWQQYKKSAAAINELQQRLFVNQKLRDDIRVINNSGISSIALLDLDARESAELEAIDLTEQILEQRLSAYSALWNMAWICHVEVKDIMAW